MQVGERLNSIDRRLDTLEHSMQSRFDQIEGRFEVRFGQLEGRVGLIDQRFNWLIGIVLATWITTILTVLFHR